MIVKKKVDQSWEILAYLRPIKTCEAAALRCLSDVVDAGDRNFEIDIAEEFPVLDDTSIHSTSLTRHLGSCLIYFYQFGINHFT